MSMRSFLLWVLLAISTAPLAQQITTAGIPIRSDSYNNAISFTANGDSITYGVGASVPSNDYVNLLATSRRWAVTNAAVSGSMTAEVAVQLYAQTISTGSQSTVMVGTNDMRTYQANATLQADYRNAIRSLYAWAAIPDANKVHASDSSVTYSGTGWSTVGPWAGQIFTSYRTSNPGDTATFSVYGTSVYISAINQNANTGSFSVTIDGVGKGTFQPNTGETVTTVNGLTYIPAGYRFGGLSEGPHTVVITCVSGGGDNYIYFDWAAGNLGNVATTGPNVWVGNITRFTSAAYTTYGGSDSDVAAFNALVRDAVNELSADGLNVALVDNASRVNPNTMGSSDGIHPGDVGYAIMAGGFEEAINQIQKPRTMNVVQPPVFAPNSDPATGTLSNNTNRTPSTMRPTFVSLFAVFNTLAAATAVNCTLTVGAASVSNAIALFNGSAVTAGLMTGTAHFEVEKNTAYKLNCSSTTNLTITYLETPG